VINLEVSVPEEGVVTITLNRPAKKNALSIALRDEMVDTLADLAENEGVSCVVVTGAGDTFCAGFDLGEFNVADIEFQKELWVSSDRFHHALLRFPLPLIAAINGPALAGGFDLAVVCDLRIASHTARFAHPERSFGDVMYGPLHDLVGGGIARELCLTGRVVGAHEARELGLVMQVVAPTELTAVAQEVAQGIAAFPRSFTIRTKAKIIERMAIAPTTMTLDL
jgi:enoyl-CoA hydratase/carnithine racemase